MKKVVEVNVKTRTILSMRIQKCFLSIVYFLRHGVARKILDVISNLVSSLEEKKLAHYHGK